MADTAMPTAQRLRQAGGFFEIGGDKRSGRVVRMLDAPIEQLYAENKLKDVQYEALRRLHLHWYLGALVGNLPAADLNRVTAPEWHALAHNEREMMHRERFNTGWQALDRLQRGVIYTVALVEIGLTSAGSELGYRSPYHGRQAALELLQSGADRIVEAWRAPH